MIKLDAINALDRAGFVARLGNIYEHAPWVAEAAHSFGPFSTVAALFAALVQAVCNASDAQRLALIAGHPELGDKLALAKPLTTESQSEQQGAGLDQLSGAEFDIFTRLNRAYRDKFTFPFIICVRRHSKDSILAGFQKRLEHDRETEIQAALAEIDRIAALRIGGLVAGDATLKLDGQVSTHVLDTHGGTPAVGVAISLHELSRLAPPRLIARSLSNADGRTDAPLIAGKPVPIGQYEMRFEMGPYFAARGIASAKPPFLETVPVRFGVADPEAHYHVPLLVTPWSYTTYRGR
jgi:2-oxo-4-hydroxy-4-carboxy-5-ureidoimidazoline decarboxylase